MKIINNKKLYSLYEITKSLNLLRKEILEYENIGLIEPTYKDQDTLYRYYDPLVILKINEIKAFKNSGFSLNEIKNYYDGYLNRQAKLDELNQKMEDIKSVTLLIDEKIHQIYIENIKPLIFYYEERNITDFSLLPSLIKEIYVHALAKDYIFASFPPFIIFNKEKIFNSDLKPFKVKICLPLKNKYNEKNIIETKSFSSLIYESTNIDFISSLNEIKKIITNNNYKIRNEIIYIYFDSAPSINKILIPLKNNKN